MNGKNKRPSCNCKDKENLLQMIRDLRKENERLQGELHHRGSVGAGSRPDETGTDNNKAEVQALVDINHGWKRDYEELQMRYEMLSGEKKKEKELKERVGELERREGPLESEITRLASALYTRRRDREKIYEEKEKLKRELEDANYDYGISQNGMPVRHEEGHFTE